MSDESDATKRLTAAVLQLVRVVKTAIHLLLAGAVVWLLAYWGC